MAENKTLLLVGDLIHDINLIENPPVQTPHFSELPETREIGTPGGVAFLYHILQKCLSSQNYCYSNRSTPVCGFFCSEDTGHKSFQTWKQFDKTKDKKGDIWRVDTRPTAAD